MLVGTLFIGKKTEWAIKTEFQRYLDSVLSFICSRLLSSRKLEIPSLWFYFCTRNGQDTSPNRCLHACKSIYGPRANKISKLFREFIPSSSCFRFLSSFGAENCPAKGGGNLGGGALCTLTAVCSNGRFTAILQERIISLTICWFS